MNCFSGTSMMFSEQWKLFAVGETAWNRTGYCSFLKLCSAPYMEVFRDVRTVSESVYCWHLVCLSDSLSSSRKTVILSCITLSKKIRIFG